MLSRMQTNLEEKKKPQFTAALDESTLHLPTTHLLFCFFVNLVGRPLFVPGSAICLISTSEVLFHITAPHLYATEVIWSHSTPKHKIKVLFS